MGGIEADAQPLRVLRQPEKDLRQVIERRADVGAASGRGFEQACGRAAGRAQHLVQLGYHAIDAGLRAIAHVAANMGHDVLAAVRLGALQFGLQRLPGFLLKVWIRRGQIDQVHRV